MVFGKTSCNKRPFQGKLSGSVHVHFLLHHVLLSSWRVAGMGEIESRDLCCDLASLVCAVNDGL